jgi:carboxyl-terminal processing protease
MSKMVRLSSLVLVCCVSIAKSADRRDVADPNRTRTLGASVESGPFHPSECFDRVWKIINEEFWDPNFNGLDWEDARERYRPKALAAEDHGSFAAVVNQMLSELKTSHTYYYTKWDPSYYTLQAALISGDLVHEDNVMDTSELDKRLPGLYSSHANPHRTGIGVVTKQLDGRYFVNAVLASSPAEKAGIVLGDWIVEVNGKPFHPIRSFENEDGHELRVAIQWSPLESSRQELKITPVDAKERQMFEKDALERSKKSVEYKGHRFSYIRLGWLLGWKMRGVFEAAVWFDRTEGIIIDIRDGFGGGPAPEYIHPFLEGGLEKITEAFTGRKISGKTSAAYSGPVIVLIKGGSCSRC